MIVIWHALLNEFFSGGILSELFCLCRHINNNNCNKTKLILLLKKEFFNILIILFYLNKANLVNFSFLN